MRLAQQVWSVALLWSASAVDKTYFNQTFETCEKMCEQAQNNAEADDGGNDDANPFNVQAYHSNERRLLGASGVFADDEQCSSFDFCNACDDGECTLSFGEDAPADDDPAESGRPQQPVGAVDAVKPNMTDP